MRQRSPSPGELSRLLPRRSQHVRSLVPPEKVLVHAVQARGSPSLVPGVGVAARPRSLPLRVLPLLSLAEGKKIFNDSPEICEALDL